MKGIELTRNGIEGRSVWVPLANIVLVQPYIGFDTKECGTEIYLNSSRSIDVKEDYTTVVEELQKL